MKANIMNKKFDNFNLVYRSLNVKQKKAVDAIEGPVMVIAGPGTGKTQILTARIASILQKTDVNPENILALTFTESGAFEMQKRLIDMIGETAYFVTIATFHSFCSEIIKANPEEFLISQNLEPLSDLERIQIFRQILEDNDFEKIKPFNARYYYLPAVLKNIQNLKREGVEPWKLKEKVKEYNAKDFEEKDRQKCLELARVYEIYQEHLQEKSRYDFEDMINLVIDRFQKNEDFLRKNQEKYQYLLVDEFQDTNSAQNEVLLLLSKYWGQEANVFVVGDDEQSIYRFQGASLENFFFFRRNFPNSLVISLDENYRSTQLILDAARMVINENEQSFKKILGDLPFEKKLTAKKHQKLSEEKIELDKFRINLFENYFIAEKINGLIKSGVLPSQIAVLFRNNADADSLACVLNSQGIDFEIDKGVDLLETPEIKKLLYLFKVINGIKTRNEDIDLFTLLNFDFLAMDTLDVLRLCRFASEKKINLFEAISRLVEGQEETVPQFKDFHKLETFYRQLLVWSKNAENEAFIAFFEKVIKESGFLNYVINNKDDISILNNLNAFFSEVKKINASNHDLNLDTFLKNLAILKNHNVSIDTGSKLVERDCVKLMTVHRAKGREFEFVFLLAAIDKKWGNNKERELIKLPENILQTVPMLKKEKNEDERRLFYVALTRAKKKIWITYASEYQDQISTKFANPSIFLSELPPKLIANVDSAKNEKKYTQKYFADFAQRQDERKKTTSSEKEFLLEILKDFKLNVTALNTYLQCPYKFKLNTLLKTPRAKDKNLSLGTAVHKSLEIFFKTLKEQNKTPQLKQLHLEFEKALKLEILSEKDFIETYRKGLKILTAYYGFYQDKFKKPLFTEKFFGYGFSKIYLEDIPLVGKVDKIELIDEQKKTVRVIDYKTGKHKSRNEIEGLTDSSDGSYKRQLVFYKLLADLDRNFPLKVVETELDFVEADEKGRPKKEKFVISDEEIKNLKKLIRETMTSIRDLKFEKTSDFRCCDNCDFRDHCWPTGIPVKYHLTIPVSDEK